MALIDPKNMVAPLTNKVHLTFILLAAVLVVILRFSGGTIARQYVDHSSKATKKSLSTKAGEAATRPAAARAVRDSTVDAAPVDDSLGESGSDEAPTVVKGVKPLAPWEAKSPALAKKPQVRDSEVEGSSLDDIERELGLRK